MRTKLYGLLLVVGIIALTGCATPTKMAFENDKETYVAGGKPIYLMTVTLVNSYRTSIQPRLLVVNVEVPGAQEKAGRLNFLIDKKGKNETGAMPDGNSYLLRMLLPAGDYDFVGLTSMGRTFPVTGLYFTPVHQTFSAKDSGVYYLGHLKATIRERQGDEFKAGPSIPLIDQAIIGASGGTFDIEITDALATDEPLFRAKFPQLKDVTIIPAVLQPFDREKAQKWWEAH